jgi:hypothetical protein
VTEYEELICTRCDSAWERPKSKGRKPKLCPTCLQAPDQPVITSLSEEDDITSEDNFVIEEPPPSPTKYQPNSKWICHTCHASVKVGVGINEPPTHACKKRMRKIFPLEQI